LVHLLLGSEMICPDHVLLEDVDRAQHLADLIGAVDARSPTVRS
jgi:hypothetical protein